MTIKTFIVEIKSEGLYHHQLVADKEDVKVLLTVLKKIEKRADKVLKDAQEEKIKKEIEKQ